MKLDHFTLRVTDLEETKGFFTELLELEVGERPPFKFPGYWLYGEGHPVIHLIGVDKVDVQSTGAIDHLAFRGDDKDAMTARLDGSKWSYSERTVPASGVRQVFIDGPEGVKIEVNFAPA